MVVQDAWLRPWQTRDVSIFLRLSFDSGVASVHWFSSSRAERFPRPDRPPQVTSAFNQWSDMVEETKELRRKMTKLAQQFRNRQIISAFAKWAEFAEESRALKVKLERATLKLFKRTMVACWNGWVDLWAHNKHLRKVGAKAMAALDTKRVAQALCSWWDNVLDQVRRCSPLCRMSACGRFLFVLFFGYVKFWVQFARAVAHRVSSVQV